jgi:predicted deacylase
LPQVRINEEFAESLVPLAMDMNLDVIWVHGALTVLEATLSHSLNAAGVPCLVVEMGVGMRITPSFTAQIVAGILRLWRRLGVIDARAVLPECEHLPLIADDHNVHYLNAGTSGLFIPLVPSPGPIRKGAPVGKIVSAYRGDVLSQMSSPVDGFLFTIREHPIVYEGSLIARIMEKPTQVVPAQ